MITLYIYILFIAMHFVLRTIVARHRVWNKEETDNLDEFFKWMIFLTGLLFDFVTICQRLNFAFDLMPTYQPRRTEAGELIYLSPSGLKATSGTIKNQHCGITSAQDIKMSRNLSSRKHRCLSWIFLFSYNFFDSTTERVSAAFNIIVYIALQFTILYATKFAKKLDSDENVAYEKHTFESWRASSRKVIAYLFSKGKGAVVGFLVSLFLTFSQYLPLIPVKAIWPNQYCLQFQTNLTPDQALCLYKVSAFALPYGLLLAFLVYLPLEFVSYGIQKESYVPFWQRGSVLDAFLGMLFAIGASTGAGVYFLFSKDGWLLGFLILTTAGFFVYFLWPPVLWLFGGLFAVYYEMTTVITFSIKSRVHFAASVCKSLAFFLREIYRIGDECCRGDVKKEDVMADAASRVVGVSDAELNEWLSEGFTDIGLGRDVAETYGDKLKGRKNEQERINSDF
jgi:hypothetical protein